MISITKRFAFSSRLVRQNTAEFPPQYAVAAEGTPCIWQMRARAQKRRRSAVKKFESLRANSEIQDHAGCSLFLFCSKVMVTIPSSRHPRLLLTLSAMEHRFTRHELYDRIWSKPMSHLVTELGTSMAILSKLLRRADIPTPSSGHWMRKEFGKPIEQPLYRQRQQDVLSL